MMSRLLTVFSILVLGAPLGAVPLATGKVHQVVHATTLPKTHVAQWLQRGLQLGPVPGLSSDQHIVFFIFDKVPPFYLGGKVPSTLPYRRFFIGIPFVRAIDSPINPQTNFFYMPTFHVSQVPQTVAGWWPYGLNKFFTPHFDWYEDSTYVATNYKYWDWKTQFSENPGPNRLGFFAGIKLTTSKDTLLSKEAFETLKPMMNQPNIGFSRGIPRCAAMKLGLESAKIQPMSGTWDFQNLVINDKMEERIAFSETSPLALTNGFPQGSFLMDADFEIEWANKGCVGY